MPEGLKCWDASGNVIFDTNTMTSRQLGERFLTDGFYQEAITANVAAGKSLYWVTQCSGAYNVYTYRNAGQGPNQFTIQGEGSGTGYVVWGEY